MNSILISISKIIAVPLVAVLTYAGYDVSSQVPLQNRIDSIEQQVQTVSQSKPKVILGGYNWSGGGTYRLQSSIGTTDTTIKLSSFKEPISGTAYTMANLNTSVAYGTLDPQNQTRSEFISFTGITQNADGTATLTGVTRGLSRSYPYTTSSTFKLTHSGQSIFILSDSPQHFSEYAVKQNDETITGDWKVPAPANATSIVNRNYVDGAAFGGIGGASETATGTVEIATGLEIASSTTNGTLGRLAIPASLATSTYNSATAPLKVVVTGNDGKIDNNFLSLDITDFLSNYFGDGSDGDVTIVLNSTTTISRDMFYDNLVVDGVLVTNGYRVFAKTSISGTGIITSGVASNGSNASGMNGALGGVTFSGAGYLLNTPGGNGAGGSGSCSGGAAATGATTTNFDKASIGSAGGAAHPGGSACLYGGGAAAVGGANIYATKYGIESYSTFQLFDIATSSTPDLYIKYIMRRVASAGGGGGGSYDGDTNGGGGGGGGASGGITFISSKTISGTFIIRNTGANGGHGYAPPGGIQGSGGGGGNGGISVMIYETKTWTGSYQLDGGVAGGGRVSGENGKTGSYYEIDVKNLIR